MASGGLGTHYGQIPWLGARYMVNFRGRRRVMVQFCSRRKNWSMLWSVFMVGAGLRARYGGKIAPSAGETCIRYVVFV